MLKARDRLRPADDTRSARLEVYKFINMDTCAFWSTIQITVCVCVVSFCASESAVPHSTSPKGEDVQGGVIESFNRGQQRNRYVCPE